jgi:squalene synthase HpnC
MPRTISNLREDVAPASAAPLPACSPFQHGPGSTSDSGWAALPSEYRIPKRAPSLPEANAYCERLARSHYENFSVATWFLPKRLRPHFCSIYAYCRISDDLGDEVGNAEQSLRLLDEWEAELNATYASLEPPPLADGGQLQRAEGGPLQRREGGPLQRREGGPPQEGEGGPPYRPEPGSPASPVVASWGGWAKGGVAEQNAVSPRHPVFIALRETIRACDIPKQPFADLLRAFRQDQTVTRYETFDDLLGYCRFSADPVGRLVLYACGYRDEQRQQLSDYTCTALQLANFWQDVTIDHAKGRIYLPLEDLRRFGVTEDDISRRDATSQFLELMRFQVARARQWFERGLPLAGMVDRELGIDIELFSRGGQEILNAIERRGYNVLKARPAITTSRKIWLVLRAALKAKLTRQH